MGVLKIRFILFASFAFGAILILAAPCALAAKSLTVNSGDADHAAASQVAPRAAIAGGVFRPNWVKSCFVPGLGQLYNKKYWKIPIIYTGFVALSFTYAWHDARYGSMIDQYNARTDPNSLIVPDPRFNDVPLEQFLEQAGKYKRAKTMSLLGMILLYALQIVDAYVDSELSSFDISDTLALQVAPLPLGSRVPTPLMALNFKWIIK